MGMDMATTIQNPMAIGIDMRVTFENGYGYGYGYGYGFLKPVPDCVPDLPIKGDQKTVKFKNKCLV